MLANKPTKALSPPADAPMATIGNGSLLYLEEALRRFGLARWRDARGLVNFFTAIQTTVNHHPRPELNAGEPRPRCTTEVFFGAITLNPYHEIVRKAYDA
jgi:hypothetical protein